MHNRPTPADPPTAGDPLLVFGLGLAWAVPFAVYVAWAAVAGPPPWGEWLPLWWFLTGMPAVVAGMLVLLDGDKERRWSPVARWVGWVGVLLAWSGPAHVTVAVLLLFLQGYL